MSPEAKSGIPAQSSLLLVLPTGTVEVDAADSSGAIIGRSDSKSSYLPDIDLAVFRGLDKGVSRRHAALVRYQGLIHLIDLNSVNGTFLNGERLVADVPYQLHKGDELILGNLNITIK